MLRLHHLNMDKAIDDFLRNVEKMSRLPLITDNEMLLLWGGEVMESFLALTDYGRRQKICTDCSGRCCRLVRCELYHPGFSQCPIFSYRPAICRMHFCDRFETGDISFIREFADIYLDSLLEAKLQGSRKVELFDSPPLSKYATQLVNAASPWLHAFNAGLLDQDSAFDLIQGEAARFRSSPSALESMRKTDQALGSFFEEAREVF